MTEKEKMIAGEFYDSQDPELVAGRARSRRLTRQLATMPMSDEASRQNLFRELFGVTGDKFFIENTFSCDYGYNIFLGENFYANFNCIFSMMLPSGSVIMLCWLQRYRFILRPTNWWRRKETPAWSLLRR